MSQDQLPRGRGFAPGLRGAISRRSVGLALAAVFGALISAYALWYTSSGHFPFFPAIQNDYVDLGQAFLHGHTFLEEQPDPRLAALPNPYEYKQRKQIPYHWDASYYGGRYYLYWGPVPALVSATLQAVFRTPPSASLLVDLAYIGLLGILLALLVNLSRQFPTAGSGISIWLFLVMGFFNLPLLFLIGQPRHYQASILYGQLFLLAGLLGFALYSGGRKPGWLAFSGLTWGLALACRYNLAISIGIYVLFVILWLGVQRNRDRFWIRAWQLIAPLALCLLGLGLYNFVRFDNPLETGLTYQLTIPEFHRITYSVTYIPSNLYAYLVYPLTGSSSFPFIQAAHFRPTLLPDWLVVPANREFDQIIFGIFRSVPVVWLSAIAFPFLALVIREYGNSQTSAAVTAGRNFLFTMIATAAAGQFMFLMVFFYTAERYVADFYLPLVLCLAIIVWRVDESVRSSRILRPALWLLVLVLTIWTAGLGYFGCFGVPVLVSNFYDPGMLSNLASFWNSKYGLLHAIWPGAFPLIG
jgi:hypothetical protein